jgi:putative flippase GtrA
MIKSTINYLLTNRVQLSKFILVGLTTCGIYFLLFHLLYDTMHLDYRVAASISYVMTIALHFLLHRLFTFKAAGQQVTRNFRNYLLMLGVNYMNMLLIVWILVDIIKSSPYIGLAASTAVSAGVSFFGMKYFVFKSKIHG